MKFLSIEARKIIDKLEAAELCMIEIDELGIILLEIILTKYVNRAVNNILVNKMRYNKKKQLLSYFCKVLLQTNILYKAKLSFAMHYPITNSIIHTYKRFSEDILNKDYTITESMAIAYISTKNPLIVELAIAIALKKNIHSPSYIKAIVDSGNITINTEIKRGYNIRNLTATQDLDLQKIKADIEIEELFSDESIAQHRGTHQ
jgi:hypothetical protein